MPRLLSSIFSFDFLRSARPRLPATLLIVALAALGAEAAFRAMSWRWIDAIGPEARFRAVLDDATRDALGGARVIVLGSSRPAFGIQARTLAADLGYGADAGVNLAYPSIYGDLMLELYRRAAGSARSAKVLVIGIDEYFLVRGEAEAARAPLVGVAPASQAPRGRVAPLALQTPEGMRWLGYRIARALGIPVVRSTLETWYRGKQGSWLSLGDEDFVLPNPDGRLIADAYFRAKRFDPALIEPYRRIVEDAKARGMKVVLVVTPSHPVFVQAARERYGALVGETLAAFRALAGSEGASLLVFDAASCDLDASKFRDQVHLTPGGAAAFTHCLARSLQGPRA